MACLSMAISPIGMLHSSLQSAIVKLTTVFKVHLVYMSLKDIMLCLSSQIFYMDIALHALHALVPLQDTKKT